MLFFTKLLFSGLALWWGLSQVDFKNLQMVFKELPLNIYAFAFLVLCFSISLNGLRLYFIAKKLNMNQSFKFLHQITWIGIFFNQLLPGGIGGDAYRIYTLSKNSNGILSSAAIIWDRILGIICMGLLSSTFLLVINLPQPIRIISTIIYSSLLLVVIALSLFIKYPILQKYKLVTNLWKIFATAKLLVKSPFVLIATSLVLALVNFAVFYFLIITLKIPLNFAESSVLFTLSLVVVLIPISISGWGLREGFLTAYFATLGLPSEMGFTLGVLQGLLMLLTGSIGAVFYLFAKKLKINLQTP